MKKNKKGFTLTELIVVIVIIAILAAVLIPTYTGIVKKARISADTQLVKSMNDALTLAEIEDGKPKTMTQVLEAIREGGYIVENLTPTTSHYDIVWSQVTGHMSLLNEKGDIVYSPDDTLAATWALWKVAQKGDSYSDGYSYYLTDTFTGAITAKAGIDVGENDDITAITYTNTGSAQDVIIRTNGGTLTIEEGQVVRHYGDAILVYVEKVDMTSYHEYGTVGYMELKQGHLSAEADSKIELLYVNDPTNVKIDAVSNTIDNATTNSQTNATTLGTSEKGNVENWNYVSDISSIKEEYVELAEIKAEENLNSADESKVAYNMTTKQYYTDLYSAIDAITDNTEQTIVLLKDMTQTAQNAYTISADRIITLDLNGKTLRINSYLAAGSAGITVRGTLIIKDNTDRFKNGTGTGKLSIYASSPDSENRIPGYANNAITVQSGSFTLESGIIENATTNAGATYCVDIQSSSANVCFNMSGGRLVATDCDQAVRLFCNAASYTASFNMSGGVIESGGFWLQQPNDSSLKGIVNVTGGEINGFIDLTCLNASDQTVTISGDAVINASGIRIRKYSNTRLLADNSNAAQDTNAFVFISCAKFSVTGIDTNAAANYTNVTDYAKFISITSESTVLGGVASQFK